MFKPSSELVRLKRDRTRGRASNFIPIPNKSDCLSHRESASSPAFEREQMLGSLDGRVELGDGPFIFVE
jgi:hypothetical protein